MRQRNCYQEEEQPYTKVCQSVSRCRNLFPHYLLWKALDRCRGNVLKEFLRFGFSSTKEQRATIQTWFKRVEELTGMEIHACQALIDELCRANPTSHWQWAGNWVTFWPANMSLTWPLTWDLGATSVAWFRPLFSLHAVVSLGQHECTQHEQIKKFIQFRQMVPSEKLYWRD